MENSFASGCNTLHFLILKFQTSTHTEDTQGSTDDGHQTKLTNRGGAEWPSGRVRAERIRADSPKYSVWQRPSMLFVTSARRRCVSSSCTKTERGSY